MRRKSLKKAPCPIARALDVIGDWWSLLIVRDAIRGTTRFSDFQKSLDVSKNILTRRLRTLVEQDILEQVPASDGSAYSEYRLTDKGRSLHAVLISLALWGQENAPIKGPQGRLVDRAKNQPLVRMDLVTSDGRVVTPADTTMLRGA